ncbi:LysR family transcriptional regulator [Nannocystis radixulma]|uniref:LysR substrate-binding domain-containing protein n=1 Tax=Nannocystis radixulma TaxID=2995305 RepID=A0ABT5B457_9BACT|nr:LysR family transcriptional regulator [Nannocystis radixulma]MDC0667851.1 LysR substrate-binding domain-containing protein [Nannocystis radixulma]
MTTVDLDRLARFVAVVETASFSAAARRLGLPKSSVSRGVVGLEQAMGVRLLHRTTRRVAATTAGAALYERTAPLVAALQRSLAELPELEEQPSGRLRVTTTVDLGAAVFADIVARFVARYPHVEVDMRLANNVVDLVADGIDVAIRVARRPLGDASFTARKLGTVDVQLYAAPTYLARRGTPRTPRELAGHAWVVYRGGPTLRLEGPGDPHVLRPAGAIVCDDMTFARQALRAGAGIGILPNFFADADVAAGLLVRVLPRWSIRSGALWLLCAGSRHLPRKVTAFREFVVEALRTSPFVAGA